MPNRLRWSVPVLLTIASANPCLGQTTASVGQSSYSTFTGAASNAGASHAINFGSGSSGGAGSGSGGAPSSPGTYCPPGSAPNQINYNPGFVFGYGYPGFFVYSPPLIVVGPGGLPPAFPTLRPGPVREQGAGGGLRLPMPPRQFVDAPAPRPRRPTNPARAREQVELGDRAFRGGNTKRAEERYEQAIKADPSSPIPRVHLAQVDMVRGDYAQAAEQLRAAVRVSGDPRWLLNAPDVQRMFGEPGDFSRHLAKLESHLQANPGDRDAWFLLGAEAYLSGRTRQASDVLQRLTDRKPDVALAAFLDASTPPKPAQD